MFVVTIDLWGTLIKASPIFSQKRLELFKKYFPDVSEDILITDFNKTKKYVDILMEDNFCQPTSQQIFFKFYGLVCDSVNPSNGVALLSEKELLSLIEEYQHIASQNPPVLYDADIIPSLKLLSEKYCLVLSSNTSFIKGETLHSILKQLGISEYFTELVFSDEMGYCKPDKRMYRNSIIHIGDNEKTDKRGAFEAGSHGIIVNGNKGITFNKATELILKTFK